MCKLSAPTVRGCLSRTCLGAPRRLGQFSPKSVFTRLWTLYAHCREISPRCPIVLRWLRISHYQFRGTGLARPTLRHPVDIGGKLSKLGSIALGKRMFRPVRGAATDCGPLRSRSGPDSNICRAGSTDVDPISAKFGSDLRQLWAVFGSPEFDRSGRLRNEIDQHSVPHQMLRCADVGLVYAFSNSWVLRCSADALGTGLGR